MNSAKQSKIIICLVPAYLLTKGLGDVTQSQMLCRGVSGHKVCGLRAHAPRISFTSKDESDPHELRRKSASSRLGSSPRTSIASDDRDGIALSAKVINSNHMHPDGIQSSEPN
ncbi:unnamed protein product [Arctia plantaginis]|uniref:Uncharacterized protein n=1 Tax=Arctia plantaginis TaxID=874455 RepID=A0A8S0YX12_ARCPL|nr:unnamed protein product [Arctia plantaginis]